MAPRVGVEPNVVGLEGRLPSSVGQGVIGAGDGNRTHQILLGKQVHKPLCDSRDEWCLPQGSNLLPSDYRSDAHPHELDRRKWSERLELNQPGRAPKARGQPLSHAL